MQAPIRRQGDGVGGPGEIVDGERGATRSGSGFEVVCRGCRDGGEKDG